jgi:hypothetical protein
MAHDAMIRTENITREPVSGVRECVFGLSRGTGYLNSAYIEDNSIAFTASLVTPGM